MLCGLEENVGLWTHQGQMWTSALWPHRMWMGWSREVLSNFDSGQVASIFWNSISSFVVKNACPEFKYSYQMFLIYHFRICFIFRPLLQWPVPLAPRNLPLVQPKHLILDLCLRPHSLCWQSVGSHRNPLSLQARHADPRSSVCLDYSFMRWTMIDEGQGMVEISSSSLTLERWSWNIPP